MRHVTLNLHGIGQPRRKLEEGESKYWITKDFFNTVLDLADKLRDSAQINFTFDDGNLSDLDIGAEALMRRGWAAEFFVLADRIGRAGSLSADDIRSLQAMGHGIGSHGAAHVDWTRLDRAGVEREMKLARQIITDVTQRPITSAAIPFGRYNAAVLRCLGQHGYSRIYSSDGGGWAAETAPIPRTSIHAGMTAATVEAAILGKDPFARRVRRRLGRAVKQWI